MEYSVSASDIATNLSWSPDGRWIASGYWNNQISSGDEVCVWSAAGGHAATRLPAGNCAPFFTPDGTRLVISSTHECIEYETGTWRELRRHSREASGLDHGAVGFAPAAGLMALMADEAVIRIVSLSSGEELARLTQPFSPKLGTAGIAFSADGQWLACEARQTVRLWNLKLLREKLRAAGLDWEDQPPAGSP